MRAYLEQIPEISFRKVPDEAGDSCSFLSWFLPSEAITRAVMAEMGAMKEPGNFYWYANNWHYISKWDHLKNARSLYRLNPEQEQALLKLQNTSFADSDAIMSKCICTSISLVWTEEQIREKGERMVAAIRKVLNNG